eukprot:scaffold28667_cov34-Phaeocystis_antarctica.AAC.2
MLWRVSTATSAASNPHLKPHIDGSWPRSGLTPKGEYEQEEVRYLVITPKGEYEQEEGEYEQEEVRYLVITPKGEYEQEEVSLHTPGAGGRSRLTYLIYLNDDFEGGATSLPNPNPDPKLTLPLTTLTNPHPHPHQA